jgi:hypothetical protein
MAYMAFALLFRCKYDFLIFSRFMAQFFNFFFSICLSCDIVNLISLKPALTVNMRTGPFGLRHG